MIASVTFAAPWATVSANIGITTYFINTFTTPQKWSDAPELIIPGWRYTKADDLSHKNPSEIKKTF